MTPEERTAHEWAEVDRLDAEASVTFARIHEQLRDVTARARAQRENALKHGPRPQPAKVIP